MRRRSKLSASSLSYLDSVKNILNRLKDYWPLTLRQVYYQLVSGLIIDNKISEYKKLSYLLTTARLDGLIPWDALEDRARAIIRELVWPDKNAFVEFEADVFLENYKKNLLESQDVALELWVEKDALSSICSSVSNRYCIPTVVAKGFSSISYLHECRKRIVHNYSKGKKTVILYLGDLDPSGWEMLPAMMDTLQNEMNLKGIVESHRCALTPNQAIDLNLPRSIDAIKLTDTRTPKYQKMLEKNGYPTNLAVELDALNPAVLQSIIKSSIESFLDVKQLELDLEQQGQDRHRMKSLKADVLEFLADRI